jgi:REP element-mobilizing transposase RayT
MQLYAHCFMPSHIYMVFRSLKEQPMALLRDFKKYTSKKIVETISNNSQESRKEWLLGMTARAGKKSGNLSEYQLWQHHNQPV